MQDTREFKYYHFQPPLDHKEFEYHHPDYYFRIEYINPSNAKELGIDTSMALQIARDGNYILRYNNKHSDRYTHDMSDCWELIAPGDYIVLVPCVPAQEGYSSVDIAVHSPTQFNLAFPNHNPRKDNIELCDLAPCPIVDRDNASDIPDLMDRHLWTSDIPGTTLTKFNDIYCSKGRWDYVTDGRNLELTVECKSLHGLLFDLDNVLELLKDIHKRDIVCTHCATYIETNKFNTLSPSDTWEHIWHVHYHFGPESIKDK